MYLDASADQNDKQFMNEIVFRDSNIANLRRPFRLQWGRSRDKGESTAGEKNRPTTTFYSADRGDSIRGLSNNFRFYNLNRRTANESSADGRGGEKPASNEPATTRAGRKDNIFGRTDGNHRTCRNVARTRGNCNRSNDDPFCARCRSWVSVYR